MGHTVCWSMQRGMAADDSCMFLPVRYMGNVLQAFRLFKSQPADRLTFCRPALAIQEVNDWQKPYVFPTENRRCWKP